MKIDLKTGLIQLKKDIKDNYIWMLAILGYIVLMNLIFETACLVVILTGMPCPACGLTRAGFSLITLQFTDAWNYNWVIFLIVPLVLYCLACRYLFQCKCKGSLPCLIIIASCLIGLYAYRMIHYYPDVEPLVYHDNNLFQLLKRMCLWFINR